MNPHRELPEHLASEEPFPLRRLFRRRFIPAFAAFLGLFLVLIGLTADYVTEQVYLDQAQRRAQTIARVVEKNAPDAWGQLMGGDTADQLRAPGEQDRLVTAFADEVDELGLSDLKVYDLGQRVLFAIDPAKIGTREDSEPLADVINQAAPAVDTAVREDGTRQYELYVPVYDDAGRLHVVFELYEPVGHLDALMRQAGLPVMAVPGALLIVLAFALDRLVRRAQADIDARTRALNELRHRIETFVSQATVSAARRAGEAAAIGSEKVVVALLYSDVRRFTNLAERLPPEAVVAFLNEVLTIQVAAVARHGGEVDKIIGDAVLARFDGADSGARAVAAAREILMEVGRRDLPRRLGIGVYRGEVILGAIGPEDRRDFTVVGDSVNIVARLCAAARPGELVADAALAGADFGPSETLRVKGRRTPLTVRRWRV